VWSINDSKLIEPEREVVFNGNVDIVINNPIVTDSFISKSGRLVKPPKRLDL